jgi:hypothetical protein
LQEPVTIHVGDHTQSAGFIERTEGLLAAGKLNGGTYTATVYPGPKGNFVFNASSCWWADGLSAPPGYVRPSVYTSPKGPDPRAQRITANILERCKTMSSQA